MSILLTSIPDFGLGDAEHEDLARFFVETDAYSRLENQERTIVLGRKGTGKTAIYSTLLRRSQTIWRNVHCRGLSLADYPWAAHAEVRTPQSAPVDAYTASWEFLILVELAQLACQTDEITGATDAHIRSARSQLRRFLEINWQTSTVGAQQLFERKKYTVDFEPKAFGIGVGKITSGTIERRELGPILATLNTWLRETIEKLIVPGLSYFLLFDDVERGFVERDPEHDLQLIGLLLASRSVRTWARNCNLDIASVVFIRTDVFESLRFSEKGKLIRGDVEELNWTGGRDGTLREMFASRLRVLTSSMHDNPWLDIFDEPTSKEPIYRHMIERTQLRPRDLVHFANLALREAKAQQTGAITLGMVRRVTPSYSRYLLQELDDVAVRESVYWGSSVEILKRLGHSRFTYRDFVSAAGDIPTYDVQQGLVELYSLGAVGARQRDRGQYIYAYQLPSEPLPAHCADLAVHPGLVDAMRLSRGRAARKSP